MSFGCRHYFMFEDGTSLNITGDVLLCCHKPWDSAAKCYMKEARLVDAGDYMQVERDVFKRAVRIDRLVPMELAG